MVRTQLVRTMELSPMKPNAYRCLGTVAMDFPFMADAPLFS